MPNQELIEYIKQELVKGVDKQAIINILLVQGWQKSQIDLAFVPNPPPTTNTPDPAPNPTSLAHLQTINNSSMWDAFEHILLFISLYVIATAIGLTLNLFVDKWFPAATTTTSSYYGSYASAFQATLVNGYIASLIVSTPIFSALFLLIQRKTLKNPTIRNLHSRKLLIYITLVVTFVIMLINVITTVYSFLSGNISLNFILHFLVNIDISSLIFGYYVYQVREDRKFNA